VKYLRALRMVLAAVRDHQRRTISDDELKARINEARAMIGRKALGVGKEAGDAR
jgi:hypothetical protein